MSWYKGEIWKQKNTRGMPCEDEGLSDALHTKECQTASKPPEDRKKGRIFFQLSEGA